MPLLPTFRLAGKSEEGTPGTFSARRSGSAEAPGRDDPWRDHGGEAGHEVRRQVMPPVGCGEESGQCPNPHLPGHLGPAWLCQTLTLLHADLHAEGRQLITHRDYTDKGPSRPGVACASRHWRC